jgi:flavin reductase (DIM6/NTAB) family NADH-FMN oxidoreductase RutF
MGIEAEKLKQVMRNWVTGVAVVTSYFEGKSHGMTINSFNSVSIDPALVVVTLANNTRTFKLVRQSNEFGVTILSTNQKEISDRFAGKIDDKADRFRELGTFSLRGSIPLLSDGLAWVECKVINENNLGFSTLFIAEVIVAKTSGGEPLLYHDREYYRLGEKYG